MGGVSSISAKIYCSILHAILTSWIGAGRNGLRQRSDFDRLGQVEGGHGAVDEVDPTGNDMPALERPDMGEILVGDRHAAGAQLADDARHLQGVPQHHRVRQQAEATRRFIIAS